MVLALKDHPAIIAWEIFNEPEGMSDQFGWDFNYPVPMSAIQKFINPCAGAIHRTDPEVITSTNLISRQVLNTLNSPAMPVAFVHTNLSPAAERFYRIQFGP